MAKKILMHAVALAMSLAIGLVGAEIVVRLTEKAPVHAAGADGAENPFVPDPDIGFRYNPEAEGVNALGLFDQEVAAEKTPGAPRVLVLGDSVTIWCDWSKDSGDTFLRRLRGELADGVELINGAVSGYTIHQERLQLERLLDLEPDIVVLQYTLNDNAEFLHQFDPDRHILLTEEARRVYVQDTTGPLGWLAEHSALALRVRFALDQMGQDSVAYPWEKYPGFPRAWKDDSWTLAEDELAKIVELTHGVGGRVVVLAVPFGPQFDGELLASDRAYATLPQTKLREICERQGAELVDLLPVFEQGGGAALFYDLVHMTAEGHRLAAEALRPALSFAKKSSD